MPSIVCQGENFDQMNAEETGSYHPCDIVGERQRPGEAVAPLFSVMHQILRNGLIGHDIGNRKSSTRFGDAKHFPEDLPFIRRQVDHTVGDDQIDGAIDHRYRVRHPFAKLDIGGRHIQDWLRRWGHFFWAMASIVSVMSIPMT